jgi:hypothetical protein
MRRGLPCVSTIACCVAAVAKSSLPRRSVYAMRSDAPRTHTSQVVISISSSKTAARW